MKIYNTQQEIDKDIIDGVLRVIDDIKINFDCKINANINALNIDALNIEALNINALNIDALNIDAHNINAHNINAHNINAHNIKALNISYYATCVTYDTLKCKSIKGRRENSIHKCLDTDIEFIK